jgi:hypothetical protein
MNKHSWLLGLVGLVVGVLGLAAFRFAVAAPEPPTHYHANFAVFVNGARLDLTDQRYMEDVAACPAAAVGVPPRSRVHLHNNDHDVVHVHHEGATWGHLMANLGFVLGDRIMMTDEGELFLADEGGTLKFILNGRPEWSVHNQEIRPGDRLLVSFGPETKEEALERQFPAVASNAAEYDELSDPAGCAGPDEPTLRDRIRHAFTG